MKKLFSAAAGAAAGIICGVFGVGGGIVAQPLLVKSGMDQRLSHAACVAVIGITCLPPAILAAVADPTLFSRLLPFLPGTVIGALAAGKLMKSLPQPIIRLLFGISLTAGAVRLIFL